MKNRGGKRQRDKEDQKERSAREQISKLKYTISKSIRHCGVKHICKSKYTQYIRFGPLLEIQISKKYTPPLWREKLFEIKELKAPGTRTTFGG